MIKIDSLTNIPESATVAKKKSHKEIGLDQCHVIHTWR